MLEGKEEGEREGRGKKDELSLVSLCRCFVL